MYFFLILGFRPTLMGAVQNFCSKLPSPSIYARKEGLADVDALERLALLVETFPDHLCISRWSHFLFWQNEAPHGFSVKNVAEIKI